jgi:hypothetical protein
MNCPACGDPTDKILVCAPCWARIPRYDQIGFRRLYEANRKNPKAYASKGDKLIRDLRVDRARRGLPCPPLGSSTVSV